MVKPASTNPKHRPIIVAQDFASKGSCAECLQKEEGFCREWRSDQWPFASRLGQTVRTRNKVYCPRKFRIQGFPIAKSEERTPFSFLPTDTARRSSSLA